MNTEVLPLSGGIGIGNKNIRRDGCGGKFATYFNPQRSFKVKVEVVDYRPEWAEMYAAEAEKIRAVLGENLIEIHHIGSTSRKRSQSKADNRYFGGCFGFGLFGRQKFRIRESGLRMYG